MKYTRKQFLERITFPLIKPYHKTIFALDSVEPLFSIRIILTNYHSPCVWINSVNYPDYKEVFDTLEDCFKLIQKVLAFY